MQTIVDDRGAVVDDDNAIVEDTVVANRYTIVEDGCVTAPQLFPEIITTFWKQFFFNRQPTTYSY